MALRTECTACGQEIVLAEGSSGRSVRCPSCDSVVSATSSSRSEGFAARPQPSREISRERSAPPKRSKSAPRDRGAAALVLGIVALVLGVPSLFVSWIPFICVVSLICAAMGLLIGIVGIVFGAMRKQSGLGLSIGGGAVNLVALLIAIVMTIVTGNITNSFQKMMTSVLDEGAGTTLPGWGQTYDPDHDCTFSTVDRPKSLSILVPPTPHDLSAELGQVNAPRVLQEMEGDFSVQVKVCGAINPVAPGNVPGRVSFQSGGLLLWSDRINYIRLERAAINQGGATRPYASLEMRENGQFAPPQSVALMDQDTYVRLERRGNQVIGSFSSDGQQWNQLQPLNVTLPAKVRVGVAVVNAAQQPLTVRFEEFRIGR